MMDKMMDIKSGRIDDIFKEVLKDIAGYQESLAHKLQLLTDCRSQVLEQVESEISKIRTERVELLKEQDAWKREKDKIKSMQPLDEIIELNVGGKEDLCVRKSTLCHVEGSALAAMFSGRHTLQKKKDRVFIDRNPLAFNMMIDFIRNQGELHEIQ